jgi:alkylation response protein AidB-like acyl-CoA dehydrogenase
VVGHEPAADAARRRRPGPEALTRDSSWSYELLRARGNTIEGGTTEILKNIVAERVLGLPRLKGAA